MAKATEAPLNALNLTRWGRESLRTRGAAMVGGVYATGYRYELLSDNTAFGGGATYAIDFYRDRDSAIAAAKAEALARVGEPDSRVFVSDVDLAGSPCYLAYPGLGEEYVAGRWVKIAAEARA